MRVMEQSDHQALGYTHHPPSLHEQGGGYQQNHHYGTTSHTPYPNDNVPQQHQQQHHQHHHHQQQEYSSHHHQQQHFVDQQFGADYSGCFVKSEPDDFDGLAGQSGHYKPQYYDEFQDIEKYKLERKRERNRIAATKCRMRKMERISQLDTEVGQLKEQNLQLAKEGDSLRGELRQLKNTLEKHIDSGECKLDGNWGKNPDSTC
eukprot:GFUD01006315.1.p1 GENE.GFUD01006315.1~~GFUD01006315.1.p1  ORF type:complete len:204 (-),score=64.74 GFUD01006315.1:90-701(-)